MRTTRGRRQAGFTLVELLIAVALFIFIMAGTASLTGSVLRSQTRLLNETVLDNAVSVTRRSIVASLGTATYIDPAVLPAGGRNDHFTALSNVGDDGVTPIVPAVAVRYFHHCVTAGGDSLHFYTGDGQPPAIVCGSDAAGAVHSVVAGGPGFAVTSAQFSRPAESPNLVQADIAFSLTKGGVTRSAGLQTQAAIQHAKD